MADAVAIWKEALPQVRSGVTGVGVWAALNAVVPVTVEDGVLYMGFGAQGSELAGHLKLPATKRLMDQTVTKVAGQNLVTRIIEGTTLQDVETTKRRDAERRRLQEAELNKMRAEMQAKTSWETVYEQLSRRFAAIPNKSLPQNRARFLEEAIELVAEARRNLETYDDLAERNFARCIERVAQYTELPSTLIAASILQRVGEL